MKIHQFTLLSFSTAAVLSDAKRLRGLAAKYCIETDAPFDAGYGGCPTYAAGMHNQKYCSVDKDPNGNKAKDVCSECGMCLVAWDHLESETSKHCTQTDDPYNAGFGGCPTYAVGAYNHHYCSFDVDPNGIMADDACSECGKCTISSEDMVEASVTQTPTFMPMNAATNLPTGSPTAPPTGSPSGSPSEMYSLAPSVHDSEAPSVSPSVTSSSMPSMGSSAVPSGIPSWTPSYRPSMHHSVKPSVFPSATLSSAPSGAPSEFPTLGSTASPSTSPILLQTDTPTYSPSAENQNPFVPAVSIAVECGPGNIAINNQIGQTFVPPSSGLVQKIAVWIKPNLYYVTDYQLNIYKGAFKSSLGTSPIVSINELQPSSWENREPGTPGFFNFDFTGGPDVALAAGETYSWMLVRKSTYSGAFSECGDIIDGVGYWLGTSPDQSHDYSFKLFTLPTVSPTKFPSLSPTEFPSSLPTFVPTGAPTYSPTETPDPSVPAVSIAVECGPGNIAINKQIGQTFVSPSSGLAHKIAVWIKPNMYYVTEYQLELYKGSFESLLGTSPIVSINELEPSSWEILKAGVSGFYDFELEGVSGVSLVAGQTYSWMLVRKSQYSGAFSECGNAIDGVGYWLGTSPDPGHDYSFKLYTLPQVDGN